MNKIVKPFDYNDVNIFLPDNLTALNKEYWELKFNSGLPDGYTDLLEAMSRSEFSNTNIEEITEKIKQKGLEFNKQVDLELKMAMDEIVIPEENNNVVVIHNNDK